MAEEMPLGVADKLKPSKMKKELLQNLVGDESDKSYKLNCAR